MVGDLAVCCHKSQCSFPKRFTTLRCCETTNANSQKIQMHTMAQPGHSGAGKMAAGAGYWLFKEESRRIRVGGLEWMDLCESESF